MLFRNMNPRKRSTINHVNKHRAIAILAMVRDLKYSNFFSTCLAKFRIWYILWFQYIDCYIFLITFSIRNLMEKSTNYDSYPCRYIILILSFHSYPFLSLFSKIEIPFNPSFWKTINKIKDQSLDHVWLGDNHVFAKVNFKLQCLD